MIFIVKIVLEVKGFHYFQHFRHQKALLHFRSQLGEEHSFCVISKFNLISMKMRKNALDVPRVKRWKQNRYLSNQSTCDYFCIDTLSKGADIKRQLSLKYICKINISIKQLKLMIDLYLTFTVAIFSLLTSE